MPSSPQYSEEKQGRMATAGMNSGIFNFALLTNSYGVPPRFLGYVPHEGIALVGVASERAFLLAVSPVSAPLYFSAVAATFAVAPALRTEREGRGTHGIKDEGRAAMLPTRPLSFCTQPIAHALVFPPFAKCAKNGAPTVLVIQRRSKAWATRLPCLSS
jgi:hypothetical protein